MVTLVAKDPGEGALVDRSAAGAGEEVVVVFVASGAVFFTTSEAVARVVPTAFMPLSTVFLALERI